MHYLIFLPNANDATAPAQLEAVGLSDHVAGAEFLVSDEGPDSQAGVLCAWRKPGDGCDLCYAPDRQTWVPAVTDGDLASGRYWVGFSNDAPPTPSELQRPYPYRGVTKTLGGQTWRIPEPKELPHDVIMSDDGSVRFELQRRFYDYGLQAADWSEKIAAVYDEQNEQGLDYSEIWKFVVQALRLNYRITAEVVNHLRLFDQDNILRTLFAAVGIIPAQQTGE